MARMLSGPETGSLISESTRSQAATNEKGPRFRGGPVLV